MTRSFGTQGRACSLLLCEFRCDRGAKLFRSLSDELARVFPKHGVLWKAKVGLWTEKCCVSKLTTVSFSIFQQSPQFHSKRQVIDSRTGRVRISKIQKLQCKSVRILQFRDLPQSRHQASCHFAMQLELLTLHRRKIRDPDENPCEWHNCTLSKRRQKIGHRLCPGRPAWYSRPQQKYSMIERIEEGKVFNLKRTARSTETASHRIMVAGGGRLIWHRSRLAPP